MMGLSAVHILIFGTVAILLFRNRLPSVARSVGRTLVEFKKGMNELESEFKTSIYSDSPYEKQLDRRRIKTISEESAFNFSPTYWPALGLGIFEQPNLGGLPRPMRSMGNSFGV